MRIATLADDDERLVERLMALLELLLGLVDAQRLVGAMRRERVPILERMGLEAAVVAFDEHKVGHALLADVSVTYKTQNKVEKKSLAIFLVFIVFVVVVVVVCKTMSYSRSLPCSFSLPVDLMSHGRSSLD